MKIKLIALAAILFLTGAAVWYVGDLRTANAALTEDNARLVSVNEANVMIIQSLEAQRQQDEKLLQQWADNQEQIKKLQASLNQQIQKELKNNESFKSWTADAYNPDAYRLLQSANNN